MPNTKLLDESGDYDSDGPSHTTEQSFNMTNYGTETSSLSSFQREEVGHEAPDGSQLAPEESVRSGSPTESIYSLTPSLLESSFMNVHGRTLNSHSEVYQLPADEEEIYRLGELGLGVVDDDIVDDLCVLDVGIRRLTA